MSRIALIALSALCIATGAIWYAVLQENRDGLLSVYFLDVGQGDAIFIDAPSGRQVLIDGGPVDGGILRQLSRVMPWYDRSIDVVIPTHPDADHIAGLVSVLNRFHVAHIIYPRVEGDTATARELVHAMQRETATDTRAQRGQIIDMGAGAYLEILWPEREVAGMATNDGCTVARLVYGNTSFMLPCDAPQAIEKYLVSLDGKELRANVLKAGHHGSRTSSAPLFVGWVNPQWVVYSRGCDNAFGHPNTETVDTMTRFGIPVADTCTEGTIRFLSNGEKVWRE
jgi:competence protein ComEC